MNTVNPGDTLYREELMEVYKNPKNRGKLQDPSVEVIEKNPVCGDELVLQLNVKEGIITEAKFEGMACAVSIISSNYLVESLIGKTLEAAKKITKDDLLAKIGMNLTTSRVACATLILTALKNALSKYEQKD